MATMRRIGLNVPVTHDTSLRDPALIEYAESLGFTDLWSQETDGHDALTPLATAAAITRRARLGTAIAGIFTRGPALLAMQAASLADAAPGRFVLGLGTSSAPIVEGWNGGRFDRPFTRVARTLDLLDEVFETGRAETSGAALGCSGFRLGLTPASRPKIALAALGARMLRLAATRADAVILSLVPPELDARLAQRYREALAPGTDGEVVLRIGALLCDADHAAAEAHARRILAAYLAVPTYAAVYERLGEGERLRPIVEHLRAGRVAEARAAVPENWVRGVFAIGAADDITAAVERFRDAGVDTPILAPTVFDGDLRVAMERWAASGVEGVPPSSSSSRSTTAGT